MAITQLENLDQAGWTEQLLSVFPLSWVSDLAHQPGGILYSLFYAIASYALDVNLMLIYAWESGLVTTATDSALDNAAKDYFGVTLPRLAGESDTVYRARIQSQLLVPLITLPAFQQQLFNLLGTVPRLISPWIAGQCSAYDWSYYDFDRADIPGIYGNPGMAYQVALEAVLPAVAAQPYGPVYSYDGGAAYDGWTASYGADTGIGNIGSAQIDALINRIKAAGITVWRKYAGSAPTGFAVHAYQLGVNQSLFNVPYAANATGTYFLFLSANWMTNVWVTSILSNGFTAESNVQTPPDVGGILNAVFVPTVGVSGVGQSAISGSVLTATITTAQGASAIYALTPSWNTNIWITSQSSTAITVAFSQASPAGGGFINWYNLGSTSGHINLTAGDQSATVSVPNIAMCPFAVPNWNTEVAVSQTAGVLTISFSTAAPSGGIVYWGYVAQTF